MLAEKLRLGQLVISQSGRDEGKYFFIVGFPKEGYLLLANGKERKISSPKLKKIKHIKKLNIVDEEIVNKLDSGEEITDASLRRKITSYL